ncbi:serine/threonine protein phosphatase, partial [Nocardia nova]|nr:serine/threonine protein phosphatase [Nocardia nova]
VAAEPPEPRKSHKGRWIALAVALVVAVVVGLVVGYKMIRSNYYVGADNGNVVIMRGLPGSVLGYSIQDVDQLVCVDSHNKVTLMRPGAGFPSGCKQLAVADLQQTGRDKVNNGLLPPGGFDSTRGQLEKLAATDLLPVCV